MARRVFGAAAAEQALLLNRAGGHSGEPTRFEFMNQAKPIMTVPDFGDDFLQVARCELVGQTLRFVKQSCQLEDLLELHYERLRHLA
jgi:hypothetical protein